MGWARIFGLRDVKARRNRHKAALAIPDEAIRREGRAQFAFKGAKSAADFLAAAREYESAVAAAPWVPGYYSDLCTIYEKAGIYIEAKRNCEMYFTGVVGAADVTDSKRRIAGLEFAIEQFAKSYLSRRDQPFRTDIAELLTGTFTALTLQHESVPGLTFVLCCAFGASCFRGGRFAGGWP